MSYVAEPYIHITDQILTALTGGVARELHRFFMNANSFGFEYSRDKVLADSISIIGQVNEAFFSFQQGRDFLVDSNGMIYFIRDPKDKTKPDSKATWPDEGSEFFVSYYHTDSDKAYLTDRNVGSLTRTLAEAFARELAVLRKQLELVYRSGFVDTAEGTALDMVVALLGITRKSREFASGTTRFFRDAPAPADIFLPQGTRVSTALNPPVSFVTSADKTLRRGQLSVEADIRAEVPGAKGVVAERTITVINQPILGISGVINDAPTVFGSAAESDGELRARAKKVAEKAGKATPRAIISSLTEVEGLKENEIKVVEELQLRPGVVQVFVARDPTPGLAQEVQEAILNSRAAGIRVAHNLAVALPASPKETIPAGEARDEGISDDIPEGPGFELPLVCDVLVFPENPRATGAEKEKLREAITKAIVSCIENSAIGGLIIYNRLVSDMMATPGIQDLVVSIRAEGDDSEKGKRNLDIPDGRKAKIKDVAKDITVTFSGAPVSFDFSLRVTRKGAGDIRKEIKEKLVDYFSEISPSGDAEILFDVLYERLKVSDTYTLAKPDLMWTIEYEQAGLIIHDQGGEGTSTKVAAGDRAVLRNVTVEEKIA